MACLIAAPAALIARSLPECAIDALAAAVSGEARERFVARRRLAAIVELLGFREAVAGCRVPANTPSPHIVFRTVEVGGADLEALMEMRPAAGHQFIVVVQFGVLHKLVGLGVVIFGVGEKKGREKKQHTAALGGTFVLKSCFFWSGVIDGTRPGKVIRLGKKLLLGLGIIPISENLWHLWPMALCFQHDQFVGFPQ
jgi:hypothetical protein